MGWDSRVKFALMDRDREQCPDDCVTIKRARARYAKYTVVCMRVLLFFFFFFFSKIFHLYNIFNAHFGKGNLKSRGKGGGGLQTPEDQQGLLTQL